MQLLVEAGATVDALTVSGRTPLMMAARSDHRETVQVCLVLSLFALGQRSVELKGPR